jgi:nitroreductase
MTFTLPGTDTITKAVELASRAPSLHNTQPWRWRYDRTDLKLYADPVRLLPDTDPTGRELILSCGAALHHFQAAMAGLGVRCLVERLPNPNDPHFLARIEFAAGAFVTDAEFARLDAMQRRYSDRRPLSPPSGWMEFEQIVRHNLGSAVDLTVVPDELRNALERASSLAEGMRRYDSGYHAELSWWAGQTFGSVGIPRDALASPVESDRVAIGRRFPLNETEERRVDIADDRATVVILSTESDTGLDFLRCGEALSVLLLEATMAGYATCPMTHLIELPSTRLVVQHLVPGDLLPQVLVRIGAAPDAGMRKSTTPRRAVSKILDIAK